MIEPGPSGIRVTMRHVRQAQVCARGTCLWYSKFPRQHLRQFCREGLPVEWVEAQGDPVSARVAAVARLDAEAGNGR